MSTDNELTPGDDELSTKEATAKRHYEAEMRARKGRAKDGRFTAGNFVYHPEYGDGVVIRQKGIGGLVVRFDSEHDEEFVEERHCVESTSAWRRDRCVSCNRLFFYPIRRGTNPTVCSHKCSVARNNKVRQALKARRAAEREAQEAAELAELAAAEAEREAAEAEAAASVAAIGDALATHVNGATKTVTVRPSTRASVHMKVRVGQGKREQVTFGSLEDAIEYLMEKL